MTEYLRVPEHNQVISFWQFESSETENLCTRIILSFKNLQLYNIIYFYQLSNFCSTKQSSDLETCTTSLCGQVMDQL